MEYSSGYDEFMVKLLCFWWLIKKEKEKENCGAKEKTTQAVSIMKEVLIYFKKLAIKNL